MSASEEALEAAQRHFEAEPIAAPSPAPQTPAYAPLHLPHSLEAEREVLAAVFVDPGLAMDTIVEHLEPGDFYQPSHGIVYAAMLKLHEGPSTLDLVTLRQELKDGLSFEQIGGDRFLMALMDRSGTTANLAHYCEVVKHKSTIRRIVDAARAIEADGLTPGQTAAECVEAAEARLLEAMESRKGSNVRDMRDLVSDATDRLKAVEERGGAITGIPYGFRDLDAKTHGMHPGELVILAARPAMGKTSKALNIAINAAMYGAAVAIFSLEMPGTQLMDRMLASEARINVSHMRSGQMQGDDWERFYRAADDIRPLNIYVDDTGAATLSAIRSVCRRLARKPHGLDVVLIDYLQLVECKADSREQSISAISRGLKALSKELDCTVIALSQLNRRCEERADKRPLMSDLRESGAIEQDADVIMFLYREEVYQSPPLAESQGKAECILSKHRNGPTGTVNLKFLKQFTRFENTEWSEGLL